MTVIHAAEYQDIERRTLDLVDHERFGTLYLELRRLANRLRGEGYSREELVEAFERIRLTLRERDMEDAEDTLLEIMDELSDWCSPGSRIG